MAAPSSRPANDAPLSCKLTAPFDDFVEVADAVADALALALADVVKLVTVALPARLYKAVLDMDSNVGTLATSYVLRPDKTVAWVACRFSPVRLTVKLGSTEMLELVKVLDDDFEDVVDEAGLVVGAAVDVEEVELVVVGGGGGGGGGADDEALAVLEELGAEGADGAEPKDPELPISKTSMSMAEPAVAVPTQKPPPPAPLLESPEVTSLIPFLDGSIEQGIPLQLAPLQTRRMPKVGKVFLNGQSGSR